MGKLGKRCPPAAAEIELLARRLAVPFGLPASAHGRTDGGPLNQTITLLNLVIVFWRLPLSITLRYTTLSRLDGKWEKGRPRSDQSRHKQKSSALRLFLYRAAESITTPVSIQVSKIAVHICTTALRVA